MQQKHNIEKMLNFVPYNVHHNVKAIMKKEQVHILEQTT